MKKIIKFILILFSFINYACVNSGYSYVTTSVVGLSADKNCVSTVNIIGMICRSSDVDINIMSVGDKAHIKIEKVSKNLKNMFTKTGSLLLDFGKISSFFVSHKYEHSSNRDDKVLDSERNCSVIEQDCVIHKDTFVFKNTFLNKTKDIVRSNYSNGLSYSHKINVNRLINNSDFNLGYKYLCINRCLRSVIRTMSNDENDKNNIYNNVIEKPTL